MTCGENGLDGIGVFGASAMSLDRDCTATLNNKRASGLQSAGGSRIWAHPSSSLTANETVYAGAGFSNNTSGDIRGAVLVRSNNETGLTVGRSGSLMIDGPTQVLNNHMNGVFLGRGGSAEFRNNAVVTVSGTTPR